MSRLRESIEKRRAEDGSFPNPFYGTNASATAVRVETAIGDIWLFPWLHFVFGQYAPGESERLVLTFVGHEVTVHGLALVGLIPEVVNQRIEWLRAAPDKYMIPTGREPCISQIDIRAL